MLMSGADNRFINNVVIDAPMGILSTNHGTGSKEEHIERLNAVDFLSSPYISAYPFISNYKDISFLENPARNFVLGNFFIGTEHLYNTDQRIIFKNNKEMVKMDFKTDNPQEIIKKLIDNCIIDKEFNRETIGRY
jgi:hypothetical protein